MIPLLVTPNLINASRALRRLLQAYERATGYPLQTILLAGGN
jgi:hypothetical protein